VHDANGETLALASTRRLDVRELGAHPVDLGDVARRADREPTVVDLGLDGHAAGDRMQAAGEAQQRCRLSNANGWSRIANRDQLSLHFGSQCHGTPHSKIVCAPTGAGH
jgi:hypothetical protein